MRPCLPGTWQSGVKTPCSNFRFNFLNLLFLSVEQGWLHFSLLLSNTKIKFGPQRREEHFPVKLDGPLLIHADVTMTVQTEVSGLRVRESVMGREETGSGLSQAMCPWLAVAAFSASLMALKIWPQSQR